MDASKHPTERLQQFLLSNGGCAYRSRPVIAACWTGMPGVVLQHCNDAVGMVCVHVGGDGRYKRGHRVCGGRFILLSRDLHAHTKAGLMGVHFSPI